MPVQENVAQAAAATVADSLVKLLNEFRAQCEAGGLLSTYEEVYEYHLGEDAFFDWTLDDWLRDAEFRFEALRGEWEYYRVSLVMAYIVSSKVDLGRGKFASAKAMLQSAEMLRHDLKGDLPSIYVDPSIGDQRPAQRGGLVKDLNRRCRSIMNCLEVNHKLDGKDFKTFEEAVEYGVEMWIAEGQSYGVDKFKPLHDSLPGLFKDWLRLNADEAARFRVFTGIAWNE